MHSVVMESLEEYLSGALTPAARRGIEAHLDHCTDCRGEVRGMLEISQLFGSLHAEEAIPPRAGFYAGVMRKVEAARPAPAFSSLFGLDFSFGRRLAFGSLLTLAVLGSYFVSREIDYSPGPSPEFVMAQDHTNAGPGRDQMLLTLTSYDER
jgi:anti-sigma factor RsiW